MRTSLLAMLIAFGATTVAMPAIAAYKIRPAAERHMSQKSPHMMAHHQMHADRGIKTRNSGASGYVAHQERPGASASPPGRRGTTTGSTAGTGER